MPLLPACAALLAILHQTGEVPPDRYASITIGITAALQLTPYNGSIKGKSDPTMSDTDDKQLAGEGFRCVRWVLTPSDLTGGPTTDPFQKDRVKALLEEIQTAQMSGLSVIIAPKFVVADLPTAASFLGQLAGILTNAELESTFLEVCAEPLGMEGQAWDLVQASWVAAIRRNMPRHTLIVHAGGQDTPADMLKTTPLPDRNVVYAFRFSEPEPFLNQCLPGSPIQEDDKVTLPYPATAGNVIPLLGSLSDDQKDWAMKYARQEWNADKFADLIRPVGDWGRSKRVRVICDSFGVSQKVAAGSRQNYLTDMKAAFTSAGLGWIVTEYVGLHGIFTGQPSLRVPDLGILMALGLNG